MTKTKDFFKKALIIAMSAIIAMLYMAVPQPVNAQTGFEVSKSIVLKDDGKTVDLEATNLPQNHC